MLIAVDAVAVYVYKVETCLLHRRWEGKMDKIFHLVDSVLACKKQFVGNSCCF